MSEQIHPGYIGKDTLFLEVNFLTSQFLRHVGCLYIYKAANFADFSCG